MKRKIYHIMAVTAAGIMMTGLAACQNELMEEGGSDGLVTLNATASLPGSTAVTRADGTNRDVSLGEATDLTLKLYSGNTGTDYSYSLTTGTDNNHLALSLKSGTAPKVKSGNAYYLAIAETTLPLTMKLTADETNGTSPTTKTNTEVVVPFQARIKYPADLSGDTKPSTATTVTSGGKANLNLAYTTGALRLRLKIENGVKSVSKVKCMLMPAPTGVQNGAEPSNPGDISADGTTIVPMRTDGKTNADPTEQTVIFGELTPEQALTAGTAIAELTITDASNTTKTLSVSWPASSTFKKTPAAGEMLTLTVHVGRTVASIDTDGMMVSGFDEENGESGKNLTEKNYFEADGTTDFSNKGFNANKPWRIMGGGSQSNGKNDDATVLENVRKALDKIYTPNNTDYNRNSGFIDLILPDVTSLPTYNNGKGAFEGYQQLRSVCLPNVKTIGNNAFKNCNAEGNSDFNQLVLTAKGNITIGTNLFDGTRCDNINLILNMDKKPGATNTESAIPMAAKKSGSNVYNLWNGITWNMINFTESETSEQ